MTRAASPVEASAASGLPAPVRRAELLAVFGVVLLGFVLRAAAPARMDIEHFDEGVYASNLYCGHLDPEYAYPDRALYAPPFLPSLLEWTLLLTGDPHSVMWVNVIAGSLTVLAVWWVTRSWFGPAAGLAAAMLAATSEFHIAFSRMALTDVLLGLWMLLGVYAGWKAVLSGRPLWIGLAGLLAGLAWCTKYNGWLTLAVTGSGTAAWLVLVRPSIVKWWQPVLRWLGSAAIAGVLFWLVAVRPLGPGGYAAVSANHAKYFVGVSGWWSGLMRQLEVHAYVNGWVTCLGVAAAVLLAWTCWRPAAVRAEPQTSLALWTSAAWFLGLLVAVPLYYPYPRLSLPLLMICWPGAAGGLLSAVSMLARSASEGLAMSKDSVSPTAPLGWWKSAGAVVAVLLFVGGFGLWRATRGESLLPRRCVAWEDHAGLAGSAGELLRAMQADLKSRLPSADPDLDAVVYVYADPAAFFHLAADAAEQAPRVLIHPAGNLGMTEKGATRRPVAGIYLVTGPRAHHDQAALDAVSGRLELIGRYPYQAGDLVLLDEYPPESLRARPELRNEELRLYRVVGN